jgi:hypothetical protein
LLTICGLTAWPQEGKPPNAPAPAQAGGEASARLHEIFFREMSAYNFFLDAEKQKKLILRREPVLRYPASPTDYCGEIYVWTERGRAAVIGCVFAGEAENATYRLFHEFHSLTTKPLVTVGGDTRWQPEEAGIEFKLVPDKAEPDKNKARRLTEMWRIARRFNASMIWKNMEVDLRFLPQPLYRYELSDEDSPLVDGAVFAFAHKELDDPEVLLVLEARRMGNETHWLYAPARLTDREAWVKYEGKEIWRTSTSSAGIFDGVTTKRYGVFIVKEIPREVGRK